MIPTPEMLSSVPFLYAAGVRDGEIPAGKRIRQAVDRFWRWIDEADDKGFYLDHRAGMHIINFFPKYINHTKGKMAGKPFRLAPFQQFTLYNVFAWKKMLGDAPDPENDVRRIKTVYDKRAKKNGKSAEMAGLALYMMSFDEESEAEVYVGATKEDQARICWQQAESFVKSHVANPKLRKMGFYTQQKVVGFTRTNSKMKPLGGDSKTQDGINAHLGIVDEYHAHVDDGVKENLESSMVMRRQPILWQITTAGINVHSACKRYEDTMIEVLEGRQPAHLSDHIFIMIHDIDDAEKWEDPAVWYQANPLLGQGLEMESLEKRYNDAKLTPSKIKEFKTKTLNMWVDAPESWIPEEIWKQARHQLSPEQVREKFLRFGGYAGGDLSTKRDITAFVMLSEPDEFGDRYIVPKFFCPNSTIIERSREDQIPYEMWRDQGFLIATEGNRVDYNRVEAEIKEDYQKYNIERIEFDAWNASSLLTSLQEIDINVSELNQTIPTLSEPTKEFEALVHDGKIRHDGNPVLVWMLAGCTPIYDTKGNMMIAKGKTVMGAKRRIDGIAAAINALAGSMSGETESNESVYNDPDVGFVC